MTIEFDSGFMVVTHQSGLVDRYDKDDLISISKKFQQYEYRYADSIALVDEYIASVDASVEVGG